MRKYELYWQNIHIGSLIETIRDMRSSGEIVFNFNYSEQPSENTHLADFIKHSIKASKFLEEGDNDNCNKICEQETKYLDLIKDSSWKIINDKGQTVKILCPVFHDNNEITWQIDFGRTEN